MVESIYGGKAPVSDPFSYCEANAFHPRFVADRRLSIQCSHLRPISELGDESSSLSTRDARQGKAAETATALNDVQTVYGRARTMSLPTIYRDGSYLRIKRPSSTSCKAHGRRFSEPGRRARQQSLESFALASPRGVASSTGRHNDSLVKTALQSSPNNSATPRRHSDPMIYVTDNLKRLRISEKANETSEHNKRENTFDSLKPLPLSTEAGEVSPSTTTRRRKWSLVPVPFRTVQQRASHFQLARRPLSFPPRKTDSFKQYNFQQATTFSNGKSSTKNAAIDSNNNHHEPSLDIRATSEISDVLAEKYVNEDILTQWMKFFG